MINKIIISLAFLFLYGVANAQTWNIGTPNAADVTATLSNGTLTISGTGEMQDYYGGGYGNWYSYRNSITSVVIEQGVTNIYNNAFHYCNNLTSVIIPESVTSIGGGAFRNCDHLPFVIIPKNVTSIGGLAFEGCRSFTSIVIPENVTSIGEFAFLNCISLISIAIPKNLTSIGNYIFSSCTNLKTFTNLSPVPQDITTNRLFANISINTATLIVPCGSLPAYQNAAIWQDFGTIVEDCAKAGVSNTQANFSCPGQVSITYDLNTTEPVDATLYYSHNKHDWLVAQTVTGDLIAQSSGTGKTIIWNNVADNVKFGKFYFKVEVPFMPEPEPECVTIGNACWATRNVGAPGTFVDKPEDFGMYYQWNSKVGWSSTDPPVSTDGSVWDSSWNGNGATTWETANNVCPTGFRVPTKAERQSLADAENKWTSLNGVSGRLFGSGSNTIFLPAAGLRNLSDGVLILIYRGSDGAYWSSNTNMNAYCLYFNSIYALAGDNLGGRSAGHSVRCVKE